MAATVAPAAGPVHRVIPESRPVMLKADLRKAEIDFRARIGACIDSARRDCGWTLDELSWHLPAPEGKDHRDPRQVARWIRGDERAQFDVLFACDSDDFCEHLFVQLAPLSRRFQPVVSIRRSA
jgi:hypothetical protein